MASYIRTALFFVVVLLLGALAKLGYDSRLSGTRTTAPKTKTVAAPRTQRNARPKPAAQPVEPVVTKAEPEPPPVPTGNPFVEIAASEGASQKLTAAQAAGRIAAEMFDALEDRPLVMIWLFDRTPSAQRLRTAAAERLQEAYRKLDEIKERGHATFKNKPEQLLTMIGLFGKRLDYLTPEPTANNAQVVAALGQLAEDPGNEEMTFEAIKQSIAKLLSYRTDGRRLMVAVVTDEIGDDASLVDETVLLVRKHAIPVFIVGMPAPLGRDDSLSQVASVENWKTVRQGPESLEREMINLEFPTVTKDVDLFDSGFGPFALSRLCLESGGAFLAVREQEGGGTFSTSNNAIVQFEPAIMARYAPDYVTAAGYKAILENKACQALHDAAQLPRVEVAAELKLEFKKTDEAGLKRDLDKAQQTAARLEPKLRNLWQALASGESDRGKIRSPRWQAGYDLAIGRALAARARIEGYNSMLAQLKQGRNFPDPKHTTWVLKPANSFKGESVLEKMAGQAKTYLERVVKEHPGTPWAVLASRELTTPIGWEWISR